mgnify:CR=1 FL=1
MSPMSLLIPSHPGFFEILAKLTKLNRRSYQGNFWKPQREERRVNRLEQKVRGQGKN